MPKFFIPAEMYPGVYRPSIGVIKPGQTMEWPDADAKEGQKPPRLVLPTCKEGLALMKKHWPEAKHEVMDDPGPAPAPVAETLTPAQAVAEFGQPEDQEADLSPQEKRAKTIAAKKAARASDQ